MKNPVRNIMTAIFCIMLAVCCACTAFAVETGAEEQEEETGCLMVECDVTGNMASTEKYFKYTVRVTSINDYVSLTNVGDIYTVDGNADSWTENNNATVNENQGRHNPGLVSETGLNRGVDFYLHHGQYIVILGLPVGSKYSVTVDPEDYNAEVKDGDAAEGVIKKGVTKVSYVNTRNGTIPVGEAYAGFVNLLSVICVGTFAVLIYNVWNDARGKTAKKSVMDEEDDLSDEGWL